LICFSVFGTSSLELELLDSVWLALEMEV